MSIGSFDLISSTNNSACGVTWCDVVWCGVMYDVVWRRVMWCDVVWCGVCPTYLGEGDITIESRNHWKKNQSIKHARKHSTTQSNGQSLSQSTNRSNQPTKAVNQPNQPTEATNQSIKAINQRTKQPSDQSGKAFFLRLVYQVLHMYFVCIITIQLYWNTRYSVSTSMHANYLRVIFPFNNSTTGDGPVSTQC